MMLSSGRVGNILRWTVRAKDRIIWEEKPLSDEAKKWFASRTYEIVASDMGYMVRFALNKFYFNIIGLEMDAEAPGDYGWVFLYDRDFNLVHTAEFKGYVSAISYVKGAYCRVGNVTYTSAGGVSWKGIDDARNVPLYNNGNRVLSIASE